MDKLLVIESFEDIDVNNIKEIIDLSDDFSMCNVMKEISKRMSLAIDLTGLLTMRMRIIFHNGYSISIISGGLTFGDNEGKYEIAIYNIFGDMDEGLFDKEDRGNVVLGYCDFKKVGYYINKIGALNNENDKREQKLLT